MLRVGGLFSDSNSRKLFEIPAREGLSYKRTQDINRRLVTEVESLSCLSEPRWYIVGAKRELLNSRIECGLLDS